MRIAEIFTSYRKSGSRNMMVMSDFRPWVEIWPFRAHAMHPAIIIGTVRSLWTWLWGRHHVPQNVLLVYKIHLVLFFWTHWLYSNKLHSLSYILLQTLWINFNHFYVIGPKATKFSKITQNNGHYAVQGHSRLPTLVPMESNMQLSISEQP